MVTIWSSIKNQLEYNIILDNPYRVKQYFGVKLDLIRRVRLEFDQPESTNKTNAKISCSK